MMESYASGNPQDQSRLRAGLEMVLHRAFQTGTASPALRRWLSQVMGKEAETADLTSLAQRLGQNLISSSAARPCARETVVEGGYAYHVARV